MDYHPEYSIDWFDNGLGLKKTRTTSPVEEGRGYPVGNKDTIIRVYPSYAQVVTERNGEVVDVHTLEDPGSSKTVCESPLKQTFEIPPMAIIRRKP